MNEDTTKDPSLGNPIPTVVSGARGNAENADSSKGYPNAPPPATSTSIPAPVTQPVPLLGKFDFPLLELGCFFQHICSPFDNTQKARTAEGKIFFCPLQSILYKLGIAVGEQVIHNNNSAYQSSISELQLEREIDAFN